MTRSIFTRKHERLRRLLIEARNAANITQEQLAHRLSRPQSFVSKIERGERRLDVVEFFEFVAGIGVDGFALLRKLNEAAKSQEGNDQREDRPRRKTDQLR